jgi:hypothetical protein
MATYLYRCPNTGLRVQGFTADDCKDDGFYPITCMACSRVHLVQQGTGRVLGSDDDDD